MPKHYKIKKSKPFDEPVLEGGKGKVEYSKESDFSNGKKKKKIKIKKSSSSMSPSRIIKATKTIRDLEQRKKGLKIAPTKQKDLSKQFKKSLKQEKGRKPQSVSAKSDKAQNVFRPASLEVDKFLTGKDSATIRKADKAAVDKARAAGKEIGKDGPTSTSRAVSLSTVINKPRPLRIRKKKD